MSKSNVIRPTRHEQSVALGHSRLISPLSDELVAYYRIEEAAWDGSSAEVVDISGNSGPRQENRVLNSEDMTAAGWTGATATPTTAEDDSAIAVESRIINTVGDPGTGPWTASFDIPKEGSAPAHYSALVILFQGGTTKFAGVVIDPYNGVIRDRVTGGSWVSPDASSIETSPEDSDYWRVSLTLTPNADNTAAQLAFYPAVNTDYSHDFNVATVGVTTGTRFQFENSSALSPYVATTGTAVQIYGNHGQAVNGLDTIAGGLLGRGTDMTAASLHFIKTANPSALTSGLDEWTVAGWINTSSVAVINPWIVWSGTIFPYINLTDAPRIQMGASNWQRWDSSPVNDGTRHFVVFTLPGTAQADIALSQFYLDGVLQTPVTTVQSGAQAAKSMFKIGEELFTPSYFDGKTDEVAVWNRVLSSNEINRLYNAALGYAIL